jgi:transcriptional regulator with XRE-family HTH domain
MSDTPRPSPLPGIAAALRRERERAGLSISELARKAGIAKSTLSQLEAGTGNPSLESLWALAVGLEVPFSSLLDPPAATVTLIRAHEGVSARAEASAYEATLLAVCPPRVRRDLYRTRLDFGKPKISPPHSRGTVEHVVVICGRARLGPAGQETVLEPGDYLSYPADATHIYEALEANTVVVMAIEYA